MALAPQWLLPPGTGLPRDCSEARCLHLLLPARSWGQAWEPTRCWWFGGSSLLGLGMLPALLQSTAPPQERDCWWESRNSPLSPTPKGAPSVMGGGWGVDTLVCEEGGATCASQTRAGRVPSWGTSLVPGQEEQGVTLRLPMDY